MNIHYLNQIIDTAKQAKSAKKKDTLTQSRWIPSKNTPG